MRDWNGFRGAAKRLDDIDLPRIGAKIGVGEDELHAFMEVEAKGSGFDSQGRPRILFEPHVFWRNLPASKRAEAQAAGLAYPKWRPGTYGKESAQYGKLERAMQIDETAALKACSWGLGQILGENHKLAGYDTVEDMVLAMMADEENHVEAMVNFLVATGIDDDLRDHDWVAVARGYNGPAHAKQNYAGRMKAAFAKWQRIRDTEWSGTDPDHDDELRRSPARPTVLRKGMRGEEVDNWQAALAMLGLMPKVRKGSPFGPKTEAATRQFQRDHGLRVDGRAGPESQRAMVAALKAKVEEKRQPAPAPRPKPETPGSGPEKPGAGRLNERLSRDDWRTVQTLLRGKGYYGGKIDGIPGKGTSGAIVKFKSDKGMKGPDGRVNDDYTKAVDAALRTSGAAGVSLERQRSTVDDLIGKSRTIDTTRMAEKIVPGGIGLGAVWTFLQGYLGEISDVVQDYGPWVVGALLLAVALYALWSYREVIVLRVQEYRQGRYTPSISPEAVEEAQATPIRPIAATLEA